MEDHCQSHVGMFKALMGTNRFMIMNMLSCGELCAFIILDKFDVSQLSPWRHMKVSWGCSLVAECKEGKSLNSYWIFGEQLAKTAI